MGLNLIIRPSNVISIASSSASERFLSLLVEIIILTKISDSREASATIGKYFGVLNVTSSSHWIVNIFNKAPNLNRILK